MTDYASLQHDYGYHSIHGVLECVGSGLMVDAWSPIPWQNLERCNVSSDYEKGYAQFARMVGEENIEQLTARFKSVCPDFETEVVSVVGGRIWTRSGIDLKTRSLCSICVLAALGRNNALN